MTLLDSLRKVLCTTSNDVLVGSHAYGCLISPTKNADYLKEAMKEIENTQKRRVIYKVEDIETKEDILILTKQPEQLPECTVFCLADIEAIASRTPIFSGFLTSPWTVFVLVQGKAELRAYGAPSARQTFSSMCKNAKSLHKSGPSMLRKRLTSVLYACERWKFHQWKEASGYKINLFPIEPGVDRTKAHIGGESKAVMTNPADAQELAQIIASKLDRPAAQTTLTDGTAHVGGNTLCFSKMFGSVTAVEIDPLYFQCLEHNVRLYNRKNVRCIQGDYTRVMTSLKQDIVFLDPPWGGIGYRMHTRISLYLSNLSVSSLIVSLVNQKVWMIVIKAPL